MAAAAADPSCPHDACKPALIVGPRRCGRPARRIEQTDARDTAIRGPSGRQSRSMWMDDTTHPRPASAPTLHARDLPAIRRHRSHAIDSDTQSPLTKELAKLPALPLASLQHRAHGTRTLEEQQTYTHVDASSMHLEGRASKKGRGVIRRRELRLTLSRTSRSADRPMPRAQECARQGRRTRRRRRRRRRRRLLTPTPSPRSPSPTCLPSWTPPPPCRTG